jgi:hypothetical protein
MCRLVAAGSALRTCCQYLQMDCRSVSSDALVRVVLPVFKECFLKMVMADVWSAEHSELATQQWQEFGE